MLLLFLRRERRRNEERGFARVRRFTANGDRLRWPELSVLDINSDHFEHFQKHWGKGHPVVVRDVLHSTPSLSWDPLGMFCAYLERTIARYENNKDLLEACLDWWEVEIDIRHYCTGSLKCEPHKNAWHEMLKLNGLLSSQLFKEQFPSHFSEVIDALPLQEYMNPMSGLFNLAANLPEESKKHDIGPYVYISYGCVDKEAYSVTNLCYDPYDVHLMEEVYCEFYCSVGCLPKTGCTETHRIPNKTF